MDDPNHTSLFGSAKRLGELAVATAHNRIELFAVELQEEKCRLIQAILLTAASIAFGVAALTLLTLTVIILFWEHGRVPALCVLSGLFIVATILLVRALRKVLGSAPGFSGTLGELEKDRVCFRSRD